MRLHKESTRYSKKKMKSREQMRVRVYVQRGPDKLLVNIYDLKTYEFDEDLVEDLVERLLKEVKRG